MQYYLHMICERRQL